MAPVDMRADRRPWPRKSCALMRSTLRSRKMRSRTPLRCSLLAWMRFTRCGPARSGELACLPSGDRSASGACFCCSRCRRSAACCCSRCWRSARCVCSRCWRSAVAADRVDAARPAASARAGGAPLAAAERAGCARPAAAVHAAGAQRHAAPRAAGCVHPGLAPLHAGSRSAAAVPAEPRERHLRRHHHRRHARAHHAPAPGPSRQRRHQAAVPRLLPLSASCSSRLHSLVTPSADAALRCAPRVLR